MSNLLEVNDLNIYLKKGKEEISAVKDVSFSVKQGKTLGIIGESGSGKSLTIFGILGLLEKEQWITQGDIRLSGEKLETTNSKFMQNIRGNKIALIMQNPMSAFNPVITIGAHFIETINKAGTEKKSKDEIKDRALDLMQKMRIRDPEAVYRSYAFQLSGGMLQRIMIALALAVEPDILLADEPTTALDLTVQHEMIKILNDMQRDFSTSILIVSHDLGVISHLAHDIAVMYAGSFVEKGEAADVLNNPRHPYTKGLFASRPAFSKHRLYMMPGQPPRLEERGAGCHFYDRCEKKIDNCLKYNPPTCTISGDHQAQCIRLTEEDNINAVVGN